VIAAATAALPAIAACAPVSIAARSVRPLQSDVDSTVTVVTAASAAASIAIVESALGLSELQLAAAPDELMDIDDELPSGIDAEAEAEALTSGVLTLGSLTLAETLAETLALTDALTSWAKAGLAKAQAAISSAAADSFDMAGFLSGSS
jgi:hypothetical protein